MLTFLQKIISIVRKTGDRCILIDPASEEAFVLMDLRSYEAIIGTEHGRLTAVKQSDTIVPNTRSSDERPTPAFEPPVDDLFPEGSEGNLMEDERFYLEPID